MMDKLNEIFCWVHFKCHTYQCILGLLILKLFFLYYDHISSSIKTFLKFCDVFSLCILNSTLTWYWLLYVSYGHGYYLGYLIHMSIPCDKALPWVPTFFTLDLWVWPIFWKLLTLLITFSAVIAI